MYPDKSNKVFIENLSLVKTQFKPARGETSDFARHCQIMGIEHITASKRRPTTIGKIEAFHKAYVNEAHLFNQHWSFIRYYNHTRPHEALIGGIGILPANLNGTTTFFVLS